MESKLEWSTYNGRREMESKKNSFSLLSVIYDVNAMKKDFVLDWRDGRVADASRFNGESYARDRVQFPC